MSEHSKGPWTLDKHGDVRDANGKRVRLVGVSLACGYAPDEREPEANRALVAAAPELVEAVRRALWHVRGDSEEWLRAAVEEYERTTGQTARAYVGHTTAFHQWCEQRQAEDAQLMRAALKKAGVEP